MNRARLCWLNPNKSPFMDKGMQFHTNIAMLFVKAQFFYCFRYFNVTQALPPTQMCIDKSILHVTNPKCNVFKYFYKIHKKLFWIQIWSCEWSSCSNFNVIEPVSMCFVTLSCWRSLWSWRNALGQQQWHLQPAWLILHV